MPITSEDLDEKANVLDAVALSLAYLDELDFWAKKLSGGAEEGHIKKGITYYSSEIRKALKSVERFGK